MKRDTALAAAIASSVGYAVLVGVTSSRPPTGGGAPNPLVSVVVSFQDTGRLKRITGTRQLASISQWLDDAFENQQTAYEVRKLPPADNVMVLNFESGETRTLRFSIGDGPQRTRARGSRSGSRDQSMIVMLEYDGKSYTIDRIPRTFLVGGERGEPDSDIADVIRDTMVQTTED